MRGAAALLLSLSACTSPGTTPAEPTGATAGSEETGAAASAHELDEAALADLRQVVEQLPFGASRADVEAALGSRLDGLGVAGTGPASESTEIYVLGGSNVLWLTWDASDASDPWLRRAVLWNQATDPTPPALPYPPTPRP